MPKLEHKKPVPVERRIFSTNLRAARKHAGLTMQLVSDAANISIPFISMVESGNQNVTVLSMAELSYAIKVPLYILLTPGFRADSFDHQIWEDYAKLVHNVKPDVLEQQLLAAKSRHYRKLSGLTQAQVDQLADFREGTTTDIERQTGNMSIDVIAPLAPVLGIPFFKLFEPN
jgi:transcriptional regulator with XRE-family HTH domain